MVVGRTVRCPPAFGDDFAVPDNHQAVQALDLLIERIDEFKQRRRGNALRFGRITGQRAGGTAG